MLDFDEMLTRVGEFGKYQKILFLFQAPFSMFVTFVLFGPIFMTLTPRVFWCGPLQSGDCHRLTDGQRLNVTSPFTNPCLRYRVERNDVNTFVADLEGRCMNTTTRPCLTYGQQVPIRAKRQWQKLYGQPQTQQPQQQQQQQGNWYGDRGVPGNSWGQPRTTSAPTQQFNSGGEFDRQETSGQQGSSRPWTSRPSFQGGSQQGIGPSPATSSRPTSLNPGTQFPDAGVQSARRPDTPPVGAFSDNGFLSCPSNTSRGFRDFQVLSMPVETSYLETAGYIRDTEICNTSSWNHNQTEFNFVTVTTEAGYWCESLPNLSLDAKLNIAQSAFFVGAIIGGFLVGNIADNYGRVTALVVANVAGCLGGILTILPVVTTNYWLFCVFRFISGFAFDNCFTMIYILVLEYVGPSYRTLVANLSIAVFYTIGTLLNPGLFWLIGNWRWFGLATSLPMLLSLGAIFIVPESARWLLSKGRAKEATNILRKFARVNGKDVEEEVFVQFEKDADALYEEMSQEKEVSLLSALKSPRICKNFILLTIIWGVIALIYDGHTRNVLNLGSNFFVIFAIASSLEFPADMLLVFILDVIGRRWLAFGSLFLAGAFSLLSAINVIASMYSNQFGESHDNNPILMIFVLMCRFCVWIYSGTDNAVLIVFAMISRFWVNVAFNIGLQYAAEILPTVIRAQGVNVIHIMGYAASIVSPFIASLGRNNISVSLSILGIVSIVAAVLSLFLPETLGEDLPNTLEDGESFGKSQSFWNCPVCAKYTEPEASPLQPPAESPVQLRTSIRASLRGEMLRSSMISQSPSARARNSRASRLMQPGGNDEQVVKLRRFYTK